MPFSRRIGQAPPPPLQTIHYTQIYRPHIFYVFLKSRYLSKLNLGNHINQLDKMKSFFFHLTLVTSCIIGRFFCFHLLYLIIYLSKSIQNQVLYRSSRILIYTALIMSSSIHNCVIMRTSQIAAFKLTKPYFSK